MKQFKHAQFFQSGPTEIMAEASTLGLRVGEVPDSFFLEHAGTFEKVGFFSDGTIHYAQTPGFLTAVILND